VVLGDSGVTVKRGLTVAVVGDVSNLIAAFGRTADIVREFDSADVGITADEMIDGFDDECPEIADEPLEMALAKTLEAAKADTVDGMLYV
jgi:hypothetical protein